tara:strand:+ start:6737 stop:7666 length:930 start_codon:yes stop_codon:yes gene_type:complete
MADIFSYNNLLDKTNQKRGTYWNGKRAGDLYALNTGYQSDIAALNTTGQQQSQLDFYGDQKRKGIGNKAQLYTFNQYKGNNLKTTAQNLNDPTRMWGSNDPANAGKWWNTSSASTFQATPKFTAVDMTKLSKADQLLFNAGTAPKGMKIVDGALVTKNAEWSVGKGLQNFGNKVAGSQYASTVSSLSGVATGVGVLGAATKYLADDKDPTTYTGNEKAGDAMSWGSTAFQMAMLIPGAGPILAIPAAITAALISTSLGDKAAKKAKARKDQLKKQYDAKLLAFRKKSRKANTIQGTQPLSYNWWNTKYS